MPTQDRYIQPEDTVSSLRAETYWYTKDQEPIINTAIKEICTNVIEVVLQQQGCQLLILTIQGNHISLSYERPPTKSDHEIIIQLQSKTDEQITYIYPKLKQKRGTIWDRNYAVTSMPGDEDMVFDNWKPAKLSGDKTAIRPEDLD